MFQDGEDSIIVEEAMNLAPPDIDRKAWWSWIDNDKLARVIMAAYCTCVGITMLAIAICGDTLCAAALVITTGLFFLFIVLAAMTRAHVLGEMKWI